MESTFGRPTPSTRRCPRGRVGSTAWRLTITNSLVHFHTGRVLPPISLRVGSRWKKLSPKMSSSSYLCGNQPVSQVILRNIAWTFVSLHAIEPTRSRRQRRVDGVESPRHRADAATEARRVDGVGRPKFDFHTAPNAMSATRPCATTSKPAARSSATPATAALRVAGVKASVVHSAAAHSRIIFGLFCIFEHRWFRALKLVVPCEGAVRIRLRHSCRAAAFRPPRAEVRLRGMQRTRWPSQRGRKRTAFGINSVRRAITDR